MKMSSCRSSVVLFVLAASSLGGVVLRAQKQGSDDSHTLAFQRAAVLTRGTNLSGWYGGAGDYSVEHTDTYITSGDVRAMV
jgi:hypothetical protein